MGNKKPVSPQIESLSDWCNAGVKTGGYPSGLSPCLTHIYSDIPVDGHCFHGNPYIVFHWYQSGKSLHRIPVRPGRDWIVIDADIHRHPCQEVQEFADQGFCTNVYDYPKYLRLLL